MTDLIIVDGMNTLWRSAYAMNALGFEDRNGWTETGAVYGFLDQVLSLKRRHKLATVLIAWEGSRKGRREIVPTYKEHRDEPDEKMLEMFESIDTQRNILKGILRRSSWGQISAPDWEADDAMATAACAATRQGLDVMIQSNDSDMLQCLRDDSPTVSQWRTSKKENDPVWTAERVIETYGVTPKQWVGVKALGGDSSDGYSGAYGVGEVWACRFMAEHGTVEAVINAAKEGELPPKKAEAIRDAEDYIRKCLELARVRTNCKVNTLWGKPDKEGLMEAFRGLRFHSLHTNRTLRSMTT